MQYSEWYQNEECSHEGGRYSTFPEGEGVMLTHCSDCGKVLITVLLPEPEEKEAE
jgi:hypothetical protein